MTDTDDTTERWLPIPGFEGRYSVSDQGQIRRDSPGRGARKGRLLRTYRNTSGYRCVCIFSADKKRTQQNVHLHVMAAFIGPKPKGCDINHKDGDKTNNCLENLEYCTRRENLLHAFAAGLKVPKREPRPYLRGERGGRAKLSNAQAAAIRREYVRCSPDANSVVLGRKYGVQPQLILLIVKGITYKDADG